MAGLELVVLLRQAFIGVSYYRVKLLSLRRLIGLADLLDMLCNYFSELVGPSSLINFSVDSLDIC
jgi:hypothetical protein